jgi:hypothetical protein
MFSNVFVYMNEGARFSDFCGVYCVRPAGQLVGGLCRVTGQSSLRISASQMHINAKPVLT